MDNDESSYAQFIKKHDFGMLERLVLCLALSPHLKPQLLDLFFTRNSQLDRSFTEFGGAPGKNHTGFLPTGETVMFLISTGNVLDRASAWELFSSEHVFAKQKIVYLERVDSREPLLSGRLLINEALLYQLTIGESYLPQDRDVFPAKRITTEMEWDDLVLSPEVKDGLQEIMIWINHESQFMKDPVFRKHVKPGFRSFFHGPPGTGKTLTASLIGKRCDLDVYRIDLSMVVSKYIGETEKNLSKVFDHAEHQNWILFFDEADALFGKRTTVNSSNDRFANQEVAYLLQRIEDFSGVIIMASNLKSNIDEAFSRRFQSIIHFSMPSAPQRLRLWNNLFSGQIKPDPSVDLESLAEKYELSGESIVNIFQSAALSAMQREKQEITQRDLVQGIRREYQKEGRILSK